MAYSKLRDDEIEAVREFSLQLYDVRQVALLFGISERTVMTYIKDGRLKGAKIGGKWKFTKEEIERFARGE